MLLERSVLGLLLSAALFACSGADGGGVPDAPLGSAATRAASPTTAQGGEEAEEGADDGASPGTDTPALQTDPEQACLDYVAVVGQTAARCGLDADAAMNTVEEAAAGGSCSNVSQLRDGAAFYRECFTWLGKAGCADVADGRKLPDACRNQLLR